jgi:hypothetical protein
LIEPDTDLFDPRSFKSISSEVDTGPREEARRNEDYVLNSPGRKLQTSLPLMLT